MKPSDLKWKLSKHLEHIYFCLEHVSLFLVLGRPSLQVGLWAEYNMIETLLHLSVQ